LLAWAPDHSGVGGRASGGARCGGGAPAEPRAGVLGLGVSASVAMPRVVLLALALALCLPPLGRAEEPDYLGIVQRYADAMLEHGTDRYGSQQTPLFASFLMRQDVPALPEAPVFAQGGAEPTDVL